MPKQMIDNVNFNYELLGEPNSNPPVILIAGYACDISFWRPLAEKLANECQVLIFDNQGIGKTEDDGKPLSVESMAANIKKLIDKLSLERPIIAGFAMGGIIAQKIALDFPHDITQLILLNSVAKFNDKAKAICENFCVLRETNKLAEYSDLLYDTVFSDSFKKNLTKDTFRGFFVPILKEAQQAKEQRRQVEVLKACDSTSWAKNIKVPTVVIAAAEDQFALPEECKALAKVIEKNGTNVEYKLVENCGHSILIEQLDAMVKWFEQNCLNFKVMQQKCL